MTTALATIPKLKSGNDAEAGEKLTSLFDDAHNGMRKIIAFGLFAWELKEGQLKHGQFGAWLSAHCPKLATADSVTGKPRPSRALSGYMDLAKNVLESAGIATITKYLGTAGKCANAAHLGYGQFLLAEDKKVPDSIKPLRDKIFEIVDGKTQKQLFTEFKQAEDDEEGNAKPKRGQLKGSKGLTKEQRERAALRAEQQRIEELEETIGETAAFLMENSDAKNFGQINSRVLGKLLKAMETATGFIHRTEESRKEKK
jgi:phosphoribosylcarboxyaminoimidazole (NCAIR) mutase